MMRRAFLAFVVLCACLASALALTPGQQLLLFGSGASGVSPTGSLTSTPERVFNVVDYGAKCDGATDDTAAINAAFTAARTSAAYSAGRPARIVGNYPGSQQACAVTQINATGFQQWGAGGRLIVADLALLCSGTGNICLDTTSSLNLQTENLTLIGSSTSPPMIGLQEGNSNPGSQACCIHTHRNMEITGRFTFAARYNAASESTSDFAPIIRNNGATLGAVATLGTITGGSGYVSGTYTGVSLTGSATGSGALASVVVSGGAVTSVTLTGQGRQFAVGDTLTAAASALGGAGSGFSVPVANIAQYAYVMDGQNYWGYTSPFQTITWPANTYYTFTENNIFGGSIRYVGSAYLGAPLWIGSVVGLQTEHVYASQANGSGACIVLFDNNASTFHNSSLHLGVECENSSNTGYDVFLTGANTSPALNDFALVDQQSTAGSATFRLDSNIIGVNANNIDINMGTNTNSAPLFYPYQPQLWNVSGSIFTPSTVHFDSPNLASGAGIGAGLSVIAGGFANPVPLDFLNNNSLAAAYSCARRLNSKYAGPLCKIRRASDAATMDVYPTGNGRPDNSTVTAFCGGTTCTIQSEYDQSGYGNHATQGTAANQPGVVFDSAMGYALCGSFGAGSSVSLLVSANTNINSLFASGGYLSVVTDKTAAATGGNRVLSKYASSAGWELTLGSTNVGNPEFLVYASTTNGDWQSSTTVGSTGGQIYDLQYSAAALSNSPTLAYQGNSQSWGVQNIQPVGTITTDSQNLVIGNATGGTSGFPGNICETTLFRGPMSVSYIADNIRRNQAVAYGLTAIP